MRNLTNAEIKRMVAADKRNEAEARKFNKVRTAFIDGKYVIVKG